MSERPSYVDRRDSIPQSSPNERGSFNYGGRMFQTSKSTTKKKTYAIDETSQATPQQGLDRDPITPLAAPYAGVVAGGAALTQSSDNMGSEVDINNIYVNSELNKKILRDIQKSVSELKVKSATATATTSKGAEDKMNETTNIIITAYRRIGDLPFLGAIIQCLLLLNVCCAIVLILPLQVREALIYPLLTNAGLAIGMCFYPLLHVLEQVSPRIHTFDIWFAGYLPPTVIQSLKAVFP